MKKILISILLIIIIFSGCSENNGSSNQNRLIQDLEENINDGDYQELKLRLGEIENDSDFLKYTKILFDNTLTIDNAQGYIEDIEKIENKKNEEVKNELIYYIDELLDIKYPKESLFTINQIIYLNEFVSSFNYVLIHEDYAKSNIEGALNEFIDRLYYKVGLTDFGYSRDNQTIKYEMAQKIIYYGLSLENYTDFSMLGSNVDVSNIYSGGEIIDAYLIESDVKPNEVLLKFQLITNSNYGGITSVEEIVLKSKIDKDSYLGVKIENYVSSKYIEDNWVISETVATSELREGNVLHSTKNINDGKLDTAWVEGAQGHGINEEITFTSNELQEVSGMLISNGYMKSESHYFGNSRIKKMEIIFDNDISIIVDLYDYRFYPEDGFYTDFISFNQIIETKSIRIRILEVYEGFKYQDTCISELEFIR